MDGQLSSTPRIASIYGWVAESAGGSSGGPLVWKQAGLILAQQVVIELNYLATSKSNKEKTGLPNRLTGSGPSNGFGIECELDKVKFKCLLELPLECTYCQETFRSAKSLWEHCQQQHGPTSSQLTRQHCNLSSKMDHPNLLIWLHTSRNASKEK